MVSLTDARHSTVSDSLESESRVCSVFGRGALAPERRGPSFFGVILRDCVDQGEVPPDPLTWTRDRRIGEGDGRQTQKVDGTQGNDDSAWSGCRSGQPPEGCYSGYIEYRARSLKPSLPALLKTHRTWRATVKNTPEFFAEE
eukprot:1191812-Prorocentrum_minimum.AAC.5